MLCKTIGAGTLGGFFRGVSDVQVCLDVQLQIFV